MISSYSWRTGATSVSQKLKSMNRLPAVERGDSERGNNMSETDTRKIFLNLPAHSDGRRQ
jgi:hypothetical protein